MEQPRLPWPRRPRRRSRPWRTRPWRTGSPPSFVLALTAALAVVPGPAAAGPDQPTSGVGVQVSVADGPSAWTFVSSKHRKDAHFNDTVPAPVGRAHNGDVRRSFFRYDVSAFGGKRIISATLRASRLEAASCSGPQVELWSTGRINRGTTWDEQPAFRQRLDESHFTFCPVGGVEFDATSALVRAAGRGEATMTLGLRSVDEASELGNHAFENDPVLVVVYNTAPEVPTDLQIVFGGPCASGDGRPVLGTATPTLVATLDDADEGDRIAARFQWETLAGEPIGERLTTPVTTGVRHSVTIPEGQLADGGLYRWRVRAEDLLDVSDFSQWCEFKVDTTRPQSPPVVTSADYPETLPGQDPVPSGGVGVPGAFAFAPGPGDGDVVSYRYNLNQQLFAEVAADGPGGRATVTLTPTFGFSNRLEVRSVDGAGNLGPIKVYEFWVFVPPPPPPPAARWRFEDLFGDVALDDFGLHDLSLAGGFTWTEGRFGPFDGGLAFDGVSGHGHTTGTVMATDASFSVSAFVRLTEQDAPAVAVSQDATRRSAFTLGFAADVGRWALSVPTGDADGATVVRVVSPAPPAPGSWTHLAGVYDAAAGELRLYVDGELAGSAPLTAGLPSTGDLQVGRARVAGDDADYWPGDVDLVTVWPRALSGEEVVQAQFP